MISKTLIAIILVAAIAVGVGAAIKAGNTSGNQTQTTASSQVQSQTTSSNTNQVSLEGTWKGTYKGAHGSGQWTWKIKQVAPGKYAGCLKTTGAYPSDWMSVTVSIDGDKITVGVTGGATFTGKISGTRASGTWKMTSGGDSGTWSGERVSSMGTLPCSIPGGSTGGETTTTTTTSSEGSSGGSQQCSVKPPAQYNDAFNAVLKAIMDAFPNMRLSCQMAVVEGTSYNAVYNATNAPEAQSFVTEVMNSLKVNGWSNVTYIWV